MFYKIALIPSMISIEPDNISSVLVGIDLSFPPRQKPNNELTNVIIAINKAGLKILFPYNEREIPAEKASRLVATPIENRHARLMQIGFSLFLSKASFINLKPRNTNIIKIIKLAKGSINVFTNDVNKYPIAGMIP